MEFPLKTGFSDFNARLYRADLGRFMNVDPLATDPSQVSISPYAFAWNDPVGLSDSSGLSPDTGCPSVGGGGSGGFSFGGLNGSMVDVPDFGGGAGGTGGSGGMSGGSSFSADLMGIENRDQKEL